MKPTPEELIAGVRSMLRTEIAPELKSKEAQVKLRRIMSVLRDVHWNDAAFELLAENRALFDLLCFCRDQIDGERGISDHPSDCRLLLERVLGRETTATSFAGANSLNEAYRDILSRIIDQAAAGALPNAMELRERVLSVFLKLTVDANSQRKDPPLSEP